ncbi:c14c152g7553 [Plasmopara halstedii]|uniref:C14c152g7553 n=1 Tax=Plasmopara halstedii TaxID=4781 RepID=A0A0N7L5H7_PLAHL|nr:c14c152g7553 [Plasmopara halstedii]CEG41507.1 c14c152g7553 [Plasmopara halstedii]|eukprot:XP_024577876.1 c14c152g7553 [Plasmopara halstedii]
MSSSQLQPRQRKGVLQVNFRVEVIGSQESLDLDCGRFYTEYVLRCTWFEYNKTPEIWDVVRRYREFCAIDILLREKYPSWAPMFRLLPSKKYIGSSLSADIVDKRQRDLGHYMMSILHTCPLLVLDEIIDSFLDIRRHIQERAREESTERRSASTPTYITTSNCGGMSPVRTQL